MTRALLANMAVTTLSAAITDPAATTFTVVSATGFPPVTTASGNYFYCMLLDGAQLAEHVKVTDITGLVFTCIRAQDNSTARTFASGASVSIRLIAAVMAEFQDIDNKDKSGGYPGLIGQAVKIWNSAKSFYSTLSFTGTANRSHVLPDKPGTIAMTSDIPALGTGIATALAINAGSAGAPVLQGGAASISTLATAGGVTNVGGRSSFAASSEAYVIGARYVSTGGSVFFGATDGTANPGGQISNNGGGTMIAWTNAGALSIPNGGLSVVGGALFGNFATAGTTVQIESSTTATLQLLEAATSYGFSIKNLWGGGGLSIVRHNGDLTGVEVLNISRGTGVFTIPALVDLSGASAGQIKFPATQNASSNVHTLDDYDEYTSASAACTGAITTMVAWKLTKVGNVVTLTLPGVEGTASANTNFIFGTYIPAKYRPTENIRVCVAAVDNNVNLSAPAILITTSSGAIEIIKEATFSVNFTAGGVAGLPASVTVSWTI